MSRRLTSADIPALARGAAVLGTGGGGDPYIGALLEDPAEPKSSLRPQLLAGARARRRPAAPTAPWAEPYSDDQAAFYVRLLLIPDDEF